MQVSDQDTLDSQISFYINDLPVKTTLPSSYILLDFIREQGLTGTKIGCREGDCGACNVLVVKLIKGVLEYRTIASCLTPIGNVHACQVYTVEGLSSNTMNPIQQFMYEENATQCGFCTPGFVVNLVTAKINDEDLNRSVDGNICRCTGYSSIRRAIEKSEHLDVTEIRSLIHEENEIIKRLDTIPSLKQEDGPLIAGGSDLYVQKARALVESPAIHIILDSDKRYILEENDKIRIGCNTTMTDFITSKVILEHLSPKNLELIASTPIRNQATIAGNLVNASPIADFAIILLVLDASLVLLRDNNKREIKLNQFFKGYKVLDLEPNEIISEIVIPKKSGLFNFEKVSKRMHLDIASVNSAMSIELQNSQISDIHISAGGVAPIPLVFSGLIGITKGRDVDAETIKIVLDHIDKNISPISDVRGSKEYKRLLLRNLVIAHFHSLFPELVQEVHP